MTAVVILWTLTQPIVILVVMLLSYRILCITRCYVIIKVNFPGNLVGDNMSIYICMQMLIKEGNYYQLGN